MDGKSDRFLSIHLDKAFIEFGIDATAFQKVMVRAALDDPAVVEYEYQVRIADGAEAMGHDEVCPGPA